MTTTDPPASMGGPQGDRTGFEPRHPNAVPARCDGCPSPARWTYKGSRYCDEHAGFAPAPSRTERIAAVAPLSDEELTLYGDLIDTVPGPGPALSWTAEARLLAEAQRARARVGVLEGQLATAQAETTDMRAALHRRLLQVKSIRRDGHTPIDPMLCTTPVTTVEEEIEDARLWWTAVGNRNGALGLDGGGSDE